MRYEVATKLTSQEAIQHAIAHFGPQGVGLNIVDQNEACLIFEGGGGHVVVTACPGKTSKEKTTVELETREWDYAVRQFMVQVG
jgi:hypothetical protein